MLHSFRLIPEEREVKKKSPRDRGQDKKSVKDKKSAVGI